MSISVAMTTYNGEKYIKEQIQSILCQLDTEDELVISYDTSKDKTFDIIKGFELQDKRIKIVQGPSRGAIANFENAILNCNNEYIFLCDQDDVWRNDKVEIVIERFKSEDCKVVIHDAVVVNENLQTIRKSFFEKSKFKKGIISNVIKNSYIGCCMAFKKDLVKKICPFPTNLPMHDQWIGIMGEINGGVSFLDEKLIFYRRHENNVTGDSHSSVEQMIKWRMNIILALLSRRKNGKY